MIMAKSARTTMLLVVLTLFGDVTVGVAQVQLAVAPDSAARLALSHLRSADRDRWTGAGILLALLDEGGHLVEGSPLRELLRDSLPVIAGSHAMAKGRSEALATMRMLDQTGTLFPVESWASLYNGEHVVHVRAGIRPCA
jgi:hypothetical protein